MFIENGFVFKNITCLTGSPGSDFQIGTATPSDLATLSTAHGI